MLKKFFNEIERWTISLKENWSKSELVSQLPKDKLQPFERTLDQLVDRIEKIKIGAINLNAEIAEELRKKALYLSELWNDFSHSRQVPIGKHQLPPLPYPYNALEPYISEEIMRLHHDKHHKSYVDGLNKAEIEMAKARQTGNFDLLKHWEREAAFNGAGHYLHTIFWNVMSPKGGNLPTGDLLREIEKSFGSFEQFKKHFTEAANRVEGVGWAILVWSPRAQRLEILQSEKHQNLTQWDVIPLLVLDVWEHAYYLQYKNNRKEYVDNWWNIVNWAEVNKRYNEAKKIKWQPY